jgi:hypothetical protein
MKGPPLVDLLTVHNLQKALQMLEGSIPFLQYLDTNLECVSLMKRNVYNAVVP